eukprot:TRINITY_DN33209_c0_g1_i1.p1 TRINITY_DN33209_c0_g1~~TRINITY_DN33209_c0_g1_i1.p1  ORF type:complete len:375 (+),score=36.18 TRINITY_DN33209_c0_g1_i1:148-1272(+)
MAVPVLSNAPRGQSSTNLSGGLAGAITEGVTVASTSGSSHLITESPKERLPFKQLYSHDFTGHRKKIHSVAWNCTGRRLASGSVDQTVRIWQVDSISSKGPPPREMELRGHKESVDNVAWDPLNPDIVASGSSDKSLRLWDIRSGKCVQHLGLKAENINVVYRPDALEIAVGNNADELTIVDVRTFGVVWSRSYKHEVNEILWDLTGNLFLVSTGAGTVEVLDYKKGMQLMATLHAHTAGVYSLDNDPLGRYIAAGAADALVTLWDMKTLLCVKTFTKLDWPVRTVSFSHDGYYLASGSEDMFIDISEVESGLSVHQIPCRPSINSIRWNPKLPLLAYASDNDGKAASSHPLSGHYAHKQDSLCPFRVFGFHHP